jgi:proteasome lid subunit RPN8/RPN11
MSEVSDPLQDSFEEFDRSIPSPDKKIIFGARKPTEETVGLPGIPLIIEAPFPTERTLQWLPESFSGQSSEDEVESETAETAIVVSQEVLLKVNEHVSQTLERELGGFLLGNRYRCPSSCRDYVIIDQYSPARSTESNEVRLAFTHEAWAQLADELSGKFLGKLLVGWYHSHPRMDVFLSSHDMDIQTERFPEPWMVALVLEPEKHRGGFFCSRDGRVKPNSPVDFYELLERNTKDSVLAWGNYTAGETATSTTPNLSPTNTATTTNQTSQEIQLARLQQGKKVSDKPARKNRWLLLTVLLAIAVGTVVGVVNRKRLKPWIQQKIGRGTVAQPTASPTPQPTATPAQVTASPQPSPNTTASPQSTSTEQAGAAPTASAKPKRVPTTRGGSVKGKKPKKK